MCRQQAALQKCECAQMLQKCTLLELPSQELAQLTNIARRSSAHFRFYTLSEGRCKIKKNRKKTNKCQFVCIAGHSSAHFKFYILSDGIQAHTHDTENH